VLLIYFSDNGRRGREKIVKKTDRNFTREGGSGEEHGNNRVWVLNRYGCPISDRSKSAGPMEYESGGRGVVRWGN